ncbi:MAG: PAS domain-containing sensor histidine kinase [Candidatus Rokuibacteriota bacterium]|nr:MAG: PAS domain-containing sensor histidine kinase [Candidatus Rokubacteria bacterium]
MTLLQRLVRLVAGRIAVKLTLTLVGFVAITLLAAGLYLSQALDRFAADSLEARLVTAGRLLHDDARALLLRRARTEEVDTFVRRAAGPTESRVTLMVPDGLVLGDSEVPPAELGRLENHAARPEMRAALAGRVGRDLRTSVSVRAPLLYVALPVRDGAQVVGVLRLALPLSAVTSSYARVHRVLLAGGLVALVVAFGIGIFVAGRVTRPVVEMQAIARQMSEGHFAVRAPVASTDELGALARALNVMVARLREQIETLQGERAKATAILDGMVEGVIAVDGHETILVMNERARAMFGVGQGRGEGKPFLEVIRNADLHEIFRAGRSAGDVARRELRLSAPVERMLRVTAVPLRLGAEPPGLVMVVDDVTELRRLEQVRTEFVANVSHELRTPLTAIQGYLETLLAGALEEPEHARRFLDVTFRHTERLGRLLNDLTDLSNIELGKVSLRLATTALRPVVDSVLEIVAAKARDGSVALATDVADTLTVHADHDRLAQILINLVDNAVKYTPPGGTVTVLGSVADDERVEVMVRDTGVGIPHADLPRITERFYRVDKARSRELGGTGLGLAIVKHLVLAHGGELTIESEEGRRTTVRFSLRTGGAAAGRQLRLPMA